MYSIWLQESSIKSYEHFEFFLGEIRNDVCLLTGGESALLKTSFGIPRQIFILRAKRLTDGVDVWRMVNGHGMDQLFFAGFSKTNQKLFQLFRVPCGDAFRHLLGKKIINYVKKFLTNWGYNLRSRIAFFEPLFFI